MRAVSVVLIVYVAVATNGAAITIPTSFAANDNGTTLPKSELGSEGLDSSILYWDMDDASYLPESDKETFRAQIIDQLRHNRFPLCQCPNIIHPFVCDNNRKIHINVCNFHCKRNNDNGIKPIMILTEIDTVREAETKCRTRILS